MVSDDLFLLSYHFVCVFCVQLSANFPKIAFFQKNECKDWFFSIIFCFKYNFGKISFLGLLEHYKNRGFSQFLWFFLLKKKRIDKKMITGSSGLGFLGPKMAVS